MNTIITSGYGANQLIVTQGFGQREFITLIDSLKILIIDEWDSSNTDNIYPLVVKNYELPKSYLLKPNTDVVYVNFLTANLESSGLGSPHLGNIYERFSLDVRVRNKENDSHARKVKW